MSEVTDYGYSYEYGVDIDVSATATPDWKPIRFISAVDPNATPVTEDAATYEDKGSPNAPRTGESWTLAFYVQKHRIASTGAYLPEVEALLAACDPDNVGAEGSVRLRWYDKPAGTAKANPDEAFSGVGTVTMVRANTGNTGIGGWNVTVTGQGRRTKIVNPAVTIP